MTDSTKSFREALRVLVSSVSVSDEVVRQYSLCRLLTDEVEINDALIRSIIVFTTTSVLISMALELLNIDMAVRLRPIVPAVRLESIEMDIRSAGI